MTPTARAHVASWLSATATEKMSFEGQENLAFHSPKLGRYVFVVGTGRCGTTTIVDLLNQIPGVNLIHEMVPRILYEIHAYTRGEIPEFEMAILLAGTRSRDAGQGLIVGESNQRLSLTLPPLAAAFPNSKLIWLLRDGREAVDSMAHHGWYGPRDAQIRPAQWVNTRVRATDVAERSPEEWARMDPFSRCCWYWAYANRVIAEHCDLEHDALLVRLEDLAGSLPSIADLLKVSIPEEIVIPHSNSADNGAPPGWRSWSADKRWAFCADLWGRNGRPLSWLA